MKIFFPSSSSISCRFTNGSSRRFRVRALAKEMQSVARKSYRSVVIGAGPAGLAALANLLDSGVHPLLWVDPCFNAGHLSRYPRVPSNTKVQLFIDFVLASPTLARIAENSSPSPLDAFQKIDPAGTCLLQHTVKMVSDLTAGVKDQLPDRVSCFQGWVHRVARQEKSSNWSVFLGESEDNEDVLGAVESPSVIFATGSHPTPVQPSWAPHLIYSSPGKVEEISLETALDPAALSRLVSFNDTVAVVGSSHSAVLCLKNLAELQNKPRKIHHYYRQEFKYAVQMNGWILYDNTGLKGDAAVWAKEVLQAGKLPFIESHNLKDPATTEAEIYQKTMGEVTKIIYAIGFRRNRLPKLLLKGDEGPELDSEDVNYLGKTGKLVAGKKALPGLWGCGIAFPEETVDPYGNQECAVGLWKFMRYLKRSIPQQVVSELVSDEIVVARF